MKLSASITLAAAVVLGGSSARAVEPARMPRIGDVAPLVAGRNQDNKTWRMSATLGNKAVLLYFYPKDDTPGCTKQACGLRDRMDDLNKDSVEVVGISFDSVQSHKAFAEKHGLNFKLIADPEGMNADAYGVRVAPEQTRARRVSFLVDRTGRIVAITDSPDADLHLSEMKAAVARLNAK